MGLSNGIDRDILCGVFRHGRLRWVFPGCNAEPCRSGARAYLLVVRNTQCYIGYIILSDTSMCHRLYQCLAAQDANSIFSPQLAISWLQARISTLSLFIPFIQASSNSIVQLKYLNEEDMRG